MKDKPSYGAKQRAESPIFISSAAGYLSLFIFSIIRNAGLPHRKAFTRNLWKEFVALSFTTGTKEQTHSIPVYPAWVRLFEATTNHIVRCWETPSKTQQMIKSELKTDEGYQDR